MRRRPRRPARPSSTTARRTRSGGSAPSPLPNDARRCAILYLARPATDVARSSASTARNASTTIGSNCVPAQRTSSSSASASESGSRYGRSGVVIAAYESATATIRAASGIVVPGDPVGVAQARPSARATRGRRPRRRPARERGRRCARLRACAAVRPPTRSRRAGRASARSSRGSRACRCRATARRDDRLDREVVREIRNAIARESRTTSSVCCGEDGVARLEHSQ